MPNQTYTTHVTTVLVAREPDTFISTAQPEVQVSFVGFEGDRHAGLTLASGARTPYYPRGTEIRNYRQVSIVSTEELDEIAALMNIPEVRPEWLGANLVFTGLPRLSYLPPSTRLLFPGEATLAVDGENLPCKWPAQVIQSHYPDQPGLDALFPKVARGLRGLVAWVERPGVICAGDEVQARVPANLARYYADRIQPRAARRG